MKKGYTLALSLTLAVLFATCACAGHIELTGNNFDLIYATNSAGTGFYTMAAAHGAIVTSKTNGAVSVTVLPTTGSEGIVAAMQRKVAHVGILSAGNMMVLWGENAEQSVRALFNGGQTPFSFMVREDSGIKTVPDLKGKRVSYVSNNSTYVHAAEAILKGYGLDPQNDVIPIPMTDAAAAFQDLVDDRTDAVMGSVQGAKMDELASKIEYRVLVFDEDHIDKIMEEQETVGYFVIHHLTREWPGAKLGDLNIATSGQVSCIVDTEDEAAYYFVKSIIEGYDELAAVTPELVGWTKELAVFPNVFPYHPGAVAYYKDAGMWSDEMEQWQKSTLENLGLDR